MFTGKYGGVVAASWELFDGPDVSLQLYELWYGVVLQVTRAQLTLVIAAHRVNTVCVWWEKVNINICKSAVFSNTNRGNSYYREYQYILWSDFRALLPGNTTPLGKITS